ncbi:hypothetical protein [Mycobacterium sp. AZCC_0083]|nr:hypothetical protein [Mycobacterium sp. AZCC_0083]MBB5161588.1 hypothetical protein [Mycobacterium sp. AZCC_0083]
MSGRAGSRHANPFISLAQAREIHRVEQKFGHLGRIKMQQKRLDDL